MFSRNTFILALALAAAIAAPAQTTPAPTAVAAPGTTATTGSLRGRAVDATGAVIPGATITLTSASGKTYTTQTTGDGTYLVPGIAPGSYTVTSHIPGFADSSHPAVVINAAAATRLVFHLDPEVTNTVTVRAEGSQQLSVASDNNASTLTLTGKDLDALSDDPDELSDELTALAGPSAGPNGGQIYIDGFTGGTLPPKSSIREIRINQNPYSAQYDKIGYGRIEVFTKPGTDSLHGQFQFQANDNAFNTAALVGGVPQPPYHTLYFQESLSGPLNKTSSYNIGSNYRIIQDNNVVDTYILSNPPTSYTPVNLIQSVFYPQTRFEISPRLDLQLTPTNTLTARYQIEHNVQTNAGVGGNSLSSTGYNTSETDNELQLSDDQTIGNRVITETRFEYEHDASSALAQDFAPSTNVQGAFTSNGNGTGQSYDTGTHWELQSYTSVQLTNHFIRFGGRLRIDQDSNTDTSGSQGTFVYGQVVVPTASLAYLPAGCPADTAVSGICNYGATLQYNAANGTISNPDPAAALGFGPTQFNASYGNSAVALTVADLGLYAEDEWKIRPSFTLTAGVRYAIQNHLSNHDNVAPRIAAAWGLFPRNGAPTFVLRGGFGLFYDRYGSSQVENVVRYNGSASAEQSVAVHGIAPATPISFTSCDATCIQAQSSSITSQLTYSQAPNLRMPYTIQSSISLEHQVTKNLTATATYINSRGEHQFFSQNLASIGQSTANNYQYVSEGFFRQNQLIVQGSYRGPMGTSLFGFYVFGHANADTSGSGSFPTQPGNLPADYGRAGFDVHQKLFLGGNMALPWGISFAPFLIANSGAPFNITLGEDLNGDNIYNDRPAFCSASTITANAVHSIYGCFDKGTTLGETPIPINHAQGPATFSFNMRLTKVIGFGPSTAKPKASQGADTSGAPPPPTAGGSSHHHDHGDFGFGGGSTSTGRKYNLSFGLQALNVFNVVNYTTPVGVLSSPQFGQQTKLAGGIFSSNTAVRRIQLQTSFSF